MKKRTLFFRLGAIAILLAIAAVMMVIGRGHTVYFDNKKLEVNGETYDTPYKVCVYVGDERVAKLYDKERGMATWIGQNFEMTLEITQEKGGDETTETCQIKLPYNMDGIVINAGAYTHTSIAILDALKAVSVPAAEVHISDVAKREDFRQVSYLGMACCCKFAGEGKQGYVHAMEKLIEIIRSKNT